MFMSGLCYSRLKKRDGLLLHSISVGSEPIAFGVICTEGEGGPAWVIFFVDDAISTEVQWRKYGARCRALTLHLRSHTETKQYHAHTNSLKSPR